MSESKLVVHESQGKVVPDICGTAVELINARTSGSQKVSFAKLIIEPGKRSRRHYHKETEEIYYILSGSGKVIIDDAEFDVGPGHAMLLPIGVFHEIANTGGNDLVFVCADAPVFDENDVYEE
ncbi:MAG: cupin domain-containing protein [Deltaproteobacteria bacterium]|nr:cupin domain-containing protein [Deltaproteobacteria bacterium]